MKLKIITKNIDSLKRSLGTISSIRKQCTLRFTKESITIISTSDNNTSQIWCTLSLDPYDVYEVESLANQISCKVNVDQMYQVLRSFDKSNAESLEIRMQRYDGAGTKKAACLSMMFNEEQNTIMTHVFKVPISLQKDNSVDPKLSRVDLLLRLPQDITAFFKRLDRFKSIDTLKICGSKEGKLSCMIQQRHMLDLTIAWNELLPVEDTEDEVVDTTTDSLTVEVAVKARDWKMGSRIVECCRTTMLLMCEGEGMGLIGSLNGDDDRIIYYINAMQSHG